MENDKVRLRRYEDDLNVGGIGVILLGAWDSLKVSMQLIMEAKNEINLDDYSDDEHTIAVGVVIAVIAVFLLLIFLVFKIHLYIGINASKAAKRQPYKKGYYTGAIILLVISAAGILAYFDKIRDIENIDITIASFMVDLTTIYILGTVISATRKIRKLKSLHSQE